MSSSASSTPRSFTIRGWAVPSTGSRTSRTFRGWCARATSSPFLSNDSPRSTRGSSGWSSDQRSPWRSTSLQPSEFPRVVDADWLARELGSDDLVVGDVRGPNAHMRGHIAGSRPLVLGSPPPPADAPAVAELVNGVVFATPPHPHTIPLLPPLHH